MCSVPSGFSAGPSALFSLAGRVHGQQTGRPRQESRPRIQRKEAAFLLLERTPLTPGHRQLRWEEATKSPSFLHLTCQDRKSTITSRKACLPGGAFESWGNKAGVCGWRGRSSQGFWKQCKSKPREKNKHLAQCLPCGRANV